MRIILFGNGGLHPSQPPACLRLSVFAINEKHHVITSFAEREGGADDFACKTGGGGCAPAPPLFLAIDAYGKKSFPHHVWRSGGHGRIIQIFLSANEDLRHQTA